MGGEEEEATGDAMELARMSRCRLLCCFQGVMVDLIGRTVAAYSSY